MSPSTRKPTRRVSAVDARRAAVLSHFGPRPFTRTEALKAGLALHDLRSYAVQPLARGVYMTSGSLPSFEMRCAAMSRLLPAGGRIAGHSAALLHHHPLPWHDLITVSVPRASRFSCTNAVILRHDEIPGAPTRLWFPEATSHVPVTAAGHLLVECARSLPLVEAVVLADSILSASGLKAPGVRAAWIRSPDPRVREVAELSTIGNGSAMETPTRVLVVLSGLPAPVVQHEVVINNRRRRFDLGWPEFGVAVEYDGSYHYASERQKHLDLLREEECRSAGWLTVSVVAVGIYRDPSGTIDRIAEALRSHGCPVHLRDEWRQHFPQLV